MSSPAPGVHCRSATCLVATFPPGNITISGDLHCDELNVGNPSYFTVTGSSVTDLGDGIVRCTNPMGKEGAVDYRLLGREIQKRAVVGGTAQAWETLGSSA